MLIVQVEPPSPSLQGDQNYRTVQPCRALSLLDNQHVISGPWLSQTLQAAVVQADVLVVCQAVEIDLLPIWMERLASGRLCIFEINDHFAALQPWNKTAGFFNNPLIKSLAYQMAHTAHGLQLSSPGLAQAFGHLNRRHQVFLNHLWEPPVQRLASPQGRWRLGWGGSLGHREDIAAIVPVVAEVLQRYPQTSFAAMAPSAMHDVFAALPTDRCKLRGLGDTQAYRQFLSGLDIGLAPLLDTPFNRCRSDIKYLEYVQAGVVPVVQALQPYLQTVQHERNGMLFTDKQSLLACLVALHQQPALGSHLLATAQAEAGAHRLERTHSQARLNFYRSLMDPQKPPASSAGDRFEALLAQVKRPTATFARYAPLALQPAEARCYLGLQRRAQPKLALTAYRAAIALDAGYALPHLYAGQLDQDAATAIRALQLARQLAPKSIAALHTLGIRYLAVNQLVACQQSFAELLTMCPSFAPAHEALGNIRLHLGDRAAAQQHFEAALAANPYFRLPAARLAVMALEQNEADRAERLLYDSLQLGSSGWLEHHLLGDVCVRKRAWQQARQHLTQAIREAPDPRPARALLARVCIAQGKIAEARRLLAGPS